MAATDRTGTGGRKDGNERSETDLLETTKSCHLIS